MVNTRATGFLLRCCLAYLLGFCLLFSLSSAESAPLEPKLKTEDGLLPQSPDKHKLGVSHNVDKAGSQGIRKDTEAIGSSNVGFIHAFIASLSVIIVSELGDKTFFIAAIMAMRHSRVTVFLGAMAALAFMTVLSAILGFATTIIPRKFTFYASSLLFAVFGLKMLKEGYDMSADDGQEEYEEVQADLKKREDEMQKASFSQDVETGIIRTPGRRWLTGLISTIFLQALTLTFLAEWGDRSQVTTIILAAREDIYGVIIGGVLGHFFCTGLAVVGGRIIAQKISTRTVTLVGGIVFIMFALSALVIGTD